MERYRPPSWRDAAECRGAGAEVGYIWWGTDEQPAEEIEQALAYCAICRVKQECAAQPRPPAQPNFYMIQGGVRA